VEPLLLPLILISEIRRERIPVGSIDESYYGPSSMASFAHPRAGRASTPRRRHWLGKASPRRPLRDSPRTRTKGLGFGSQPPRLRLHLVRGVRLGAPTLSRRRTGPTHPRRRCALTSHKNGWVRLVCVFDNGNSQKNDPVKGHFVLAVRVVGPCNKRRPVEISLGVKQAHADRTQPIWDIFLAPFFPTIVPEVGRSAARCCPPSAAHPLEDGCGPTPPSTESLVGIVGEGRRRVRIASGRKYSRFVRGFDSIL
jgi:hypothetical protein